MAAFYPTYGGTWYGWTSASTTATTVWTAWSAATTTNVTAASNVLNVWTSWVDVTGAPGPVIVNQAGYARQPTEEELEARRAEQQKQAEARETARQRARSLLESMLDDMQREQFNKDGFFHVQTRDGEREYRLAPGRPPIRVKGEDGRRFSYCIHPTGGFNAEDVTISQFLMLVSDEEQFLRVANATAA